MKPANWLAKPQDATVSVYMHLHKFVIYRLGQDTHLGL